MKRNTKGSRDNNGIRLEVKIPAFLLAFLISAVATGQGIVQQLDSMAANHNLAGSVVLFIKQDTILLEHYTGMADIGRAIPVSDTTFFRVASVSKTVTAIAVMKLYQQGLLDLSEDISTYFGYTVRNPDYPTVVITPRMLLSHQSSIRDGSGYFSFLTATSQSPPVPSIQQLLIPSGTFFTPDCWRSTEPPGTYFEYANLNYAILGTLIENVSGQRFDQFVRQQVLLPLGIEGSFNIHDLPNPDRIAVLYRKQGGNWVPQADHYNGVLPSPVNLSGYVPGTNGLLFGPQGSLRLTAKELSLILRLLANRGVVNGIRILDDSTVDLMKTKFYCYTCGNSGNNMGGLFRGYGLGLHITTNFPHEDIIFPGIEMHGHPGEAYGLLSDMYFDQKGILGVVFITNGVGTGIQYGTQSVFYACEEDVFLSLYQHFIASQGITGIETNENDFILYPNPTHTGKLHFGHDSSVKFPVWIAVLDLSGKIVLKTVIRDREQPVDVSNLESGFYFISIESDNRAPKIIKFISERQITK